MIRSLLIVVLAMWFQEAMPQDNKALRKAAYYQHRIPDSALWYIHQIPQKELESDELFIVWEIQAASYKSISDYQKADSVISLLLQLAQQQQSELHKQIAINELAGLRWRMGLYPEADSLFSLIDEHFLLSAPPQLAADVHVNKALLFWNMGALNRSLEEDYAGMLLAEESNDFYNLARAWNVIGLVEMDKENYDAAYAPIRKAYQINKEHGFLKGQCVNLNNIALLHKYQGQNDSALVLFEQVLHLTDSFNFKTDLARALHNIGDVYQNLQLYDTALAYKKRSLRLAEELGANRSIALACNTIGDIYLELGDVAQGLAYSARAKDIAEKENITRQAYYANLQISEAYRHLGRFEQALTALHTSNAYRETMLNEQLNDRIAFYRELYESEKVKQMLDEKSYQLNLEKERGRLIQARWIISIGGLVVLMIIVVLLIQRKHQKAKNRRHKKFTSDLIQKQEEERVRIAKELHDGVGQNLSLVKNMVTTPDGNTKVAEQVQFAIDEIRTISRNLHPIDLTIFGLKKSIERLVKRTAEVSGIFATHDIDLAGLKLSQLYEINFYRIIQECLNNIVKHSQATAAKVSMSKDEHYITLVVQDNGVGCPSEKMSNHGMGIRSIEERTLVMNGSCKIQSKPNKGTSITIKCPI